MRRTHFETPHAAIAVAVAALMAACGGGADDAVDFDASTADGTTPLAVVASGRDANGPMTEDVRAADHDGTAPVIVDLYQRASGDLDFGGRNIAASMDEVGRTAALGATSAASATPTEGPLE